MVPKCRGRAYLSENEVEIEVVHRGAISGKMSREWSQIVYGPRVSGSKRVKKWIRLSFFDIQSKQLFSRRVGWSWAWDHGHGNVLLVLVPVLVVVIRIFLHFFLH